MRRATRRFDVGLHGVDVLVDAVRRWLTLPVHQHVVGVVVGEHAGPVGVVPSDRVKIIHALEVAVDLVFGHESLLS